MAEGHPPPRRLVLVSFNLLLSSSPSFPLSHLLCQGSFIFHKTQLLRDFHSVQILDGTGQVRPARSTKEEISQKLPGQDPLQGAGTIVCAWRPEPGELPGPAGLERGTLDQQLAEAGGSSSRTIFLRSPHFE